jgi:hypothetical protein
MAGGASEVPARQNENAPEEMKPAARSGTMFLRLCKTRWRPSARTGGFLACYNLCVCLKGMELAMRSFAVRTTRGKGRRVIGRSPAERNGKKVPFRDLKAFGMWRNRADLKDPVLFTNELRARMERLVDAR